MYVGRPWMRSNLASIAIAQALTRSVLPVPVGPRNMMWGWRSFFPWLSLSVYGRSVKNAHERIRAASSSPYSHLVDSLWKRCTTSLARSRSIAGLVSTVIARTSRLSPEGNGAPACPAAGAARKRRKHISVAGSALGCCARAGETGQTPGQAGLDGNRRPPRDRSGRVRRRLSGERLGIRPGECQHGPFARRRRSRTWDGGTRRNGTMPLLTAEDYKNSLRDGRTVYYRGRRVEDVTTHPVIGRAGDHAAIDYRMAHDASDRPLAVVDGPNGPCSRYYAIPRTPEDLLQRSALIERSTALGGTLVILIKEIGTDALLALRLIAGHLDRTKKTSYLKRVEAFHAHCRDRDLAVAVAQTDVKGDRSKGPTGQDHPDYYVRVVAQDADGVTLRGAKVHTSVSTNAHEIIVLPTRNLSSGEEAYAVACAVPANAPGLTMLASGYGRSGHAFEHPISAKHKMMET
ncbi:MAG: hypothetical protein F4Y14_18915, partial [Acidobacteria bacterium]|nr:hypothetical protein [Acidobacteriota bacterium]